MNPQTFKQRLVHVLGCLCLLLLSITAQAQRTFRITEISARFYPPEKLDSLTHAVLLKEAQANQIGAASFNERYSAYRWRVTDFMYALLIVPFTQLDLIYGDKRPQPGSPEFEAISQRYETHALQVLTRIVANPTSIHPILQKDESDRIQLFKSELIVSKDGKIDVTETIRIYNGDGSMYSQNNEIKHGLLRDFPTKYLDTVGYWVRRGFNIVSVSLDGKKVPYKTYPLQYGTRVMIGDEKEYLSKGVYTYVIRYTTNLQILFHPDRDELYWNVTGNGWSFTMDSVIAQIQFPAEAEIGAQQCYTGSLGSSNQDCNWQKLSGQTIEFSTSKGLQPYEGLTIAADIQKGVLTGPGAISKVWNIILSNWIVPALLLVVLGVFFFYYRTWHRKGRDPKSEGIALQSAPPPGLGPADVGYIHQQQYGSHLFVAELIYAAVHGHLEIEINKGNSWLSGTSYSFRQPARPGKPVPFAQYIPLVAVNYLYGLTLQSRGHNSTFRSLYQALETFLKNKYQIQKGAQQSATGYFALNRSNLFIGVMLAVVAAVVSIFFLAYNFTPLLCIFCLIMILILIAILIIFYRLLPAYTPEGRKIADQIEGFRRYLLDAGDKSFRDLSPYDKPLNLFERYLPYAIALKVENAWSKRFESVLNAALEDGYRPSYFYPGRSFVRPMSYSDFSSGISSGLSSSISSASSPPGSSGSRGGGFSGGGGGGGGGGGW